MRVLPDAPSSMRAGIVGIAFSTGPRDADYVPTGHRGPAPSLVEGPAEIPSIADTSGLVRPVVGPSLLKNSTVEFDLSLHEAFGLVRNRPDATADAEQSAPTEITAAGEPPASLCAVTL